MLLEAVLCRGPYILVPGTPAIGGVGVAWEVVGALWWGAYTARESAKVQASLNGFSSVMRSQFGELKQTPWLLPARDCGGVALTQGRWHGERWRFVSVAGQNRSICVCVQHTQMSGWLLFIPEPPPPSSLTHHFIDLSSQMDEGWRTNTCWSHFGHEFADHTENTVAP